jgi:hypothetical protein
MSTPTADDIIADLESRGLGWSIEHTGRLIEACVWDWPAVIGRYRPDNPSHEYRERPMESWPTVIGRYRPAKVEPLAKMLAAACFDVDWTKYPVKL